MITIFAWDFGFERVVICCSLMSTFFTDTSLKAMRFDTMQSAYIHLRVQAMKSGFDIGSTQSFHSVYSTFYCLKGGRQRGEKTTKTGCAWRLTIVPDSESKSFGAVRIKECFLEHNHDLHPDIYSVFNCSDTSQDLIRSMREASIEPRKIIRVMESLGEEGLTVSQIRRICGPKSTAIGISESAELENYVSECGGLCARHIVDENHCQGVLTIMPFEMENLRRFSSVIFLDGTQTHCHLNWEVIPITMVDQYRRIRSGGICFLSSTDEETLTWLLDTLLSIDIVKESVQTIITDEDSAFIPAIENLNDSLHFKHILCSFHKERNFGRKLLRCGLSELERAVAKDLFRSICYGTHRESTDRAIEELKRMSSKLSHYIDKQVIPTLGQFARAYLSNTFSKGYNTTSPAEAHNAMLKNFLSGRSLTLKQTRIDFTRCHSEADKNFNEKMLRSFRNDHFTFTLGRYMLSPKIRREIDEMNALVGKYCCTLIKEDQWRVFLSNSPQTAHTATPQSCDCGRSVSEGLPCVHVLRVIKEVMGDDYQNWPFALISSEWIIQRPEDVIIPTDLDGRVAACNEVDLPEVELTEVALTEEDVVAEVDEIDCSDNQHQIGTDDLGHMWNQPEYLKRKKRYLKLYHMAKSVVSIASRDESNSSRLLRELFNIKRELLSLPIAEPSFNDDCMNDPEQDAPNTEAGTPANAVDPPIVDVIDVRGVRRGRKKKSVNEKQYRLRHKRTVSCQLCGKRHELTQCPKYPDFQAAIQHNKELPEQEGRHRCRMCCGIGHNTKTCPWNAANSHHQ